MDIEKDILENIDIDIDQDILENINIVIDILEREKLQNIGINKILLEVLVCT